MIERSYVGGLVGREVAPALDGGVPVGARGRVGTTCEVFERRVVGRDQATPCPALDRHVADGHPLLHRQCADRLAGVFEDVARPAADPDPGDEREDDVLGADTRHEPAVDPDLERLRLALEQALGREDHLDLGGPDAERERPECSVGRGVRIAAHDRHAGLGETQLGTDDVDDPLGRRSEPVKRDPELPAVVGELLDLRRGHRVQDRQVAWMGRDRVVGRRNGPIRSADREAALRGGR